MANEIYDSTWWGNTIETASSIGTSTEMIQGQFNMLTSNQPNLVVNGDFATDSDWTKGIGWSISGGSANSDGSQISTSGLIQTNVFENANTYKLNFDLISNGEVLKFWVNGTQNIFSSILSDGSHQYYFTTTTSGSAYFEATSNFIGSIDNVSVKKVRATTVEASKCLADAIHRIGIQDIQN